LATAEHQHQRKYAASTFASAATCIGIIKRSSGTWTKDELKLSDETWTKDSQTAALLGLLGHNGEIKWNSIVIYDWRVHDEVERYRQDAPKRAAKDL
jgi:hypothetical protein